MASHTCRLFGCGEESGEWERCTRYWCLFRDRVLDALTNNNPCRVLQKWIAHWPRTNSRPRRKRFGEAGKRRQFTAKYGLKDGGEVDGQKERYRVFFTLIKLSIKATH